MISIDSKDIDLNTQQLDLSKKELKYLPNSIRKLTNLTRLYLNINKLKFLPNSIGELSELSELEISSNELTSLPDSIGDLTELSILYISENKLSSLPNSIGELSELSELDLSHNKLISLPNSIGKLSKLSALEVSHNELVSLPDSIGDLTELSDLYLSHNKLTSLPDSIGDLIQLSEVDLSHNELVSLPSSMRHLKLERLDLRNNPVYTSIKREYPNFDDLSVPEQLELLTSDIEVKPEWKVGCESHDDKYNSTIKEVYITVKNLFNEKFENNLSQDEMCAEIESTLIRQRNDYINCTNNNISGFEWKELAPYDVIAVQEEKMNYCFTVEEVIKMKKNPYTRTPFSQRIIEEALRRKKLIKILNM